MATNLLISFIMRPYNQRKLARTLTIRTPNGVAEQLFVTIGGIDQWITIRGEDRANPVLLFVHGGPGAVYSILTPLVRAWERYFTVVQWDQRGAGKTFGKSGQSGAGVLTFDRLAQDGIEVAEFLRAHLGQQKIILIGSSVGSLTGLMMAKRRPDLFSAYVGTDQNTGSDSLRQSYQLTLDGLRAAGNTKGVRVVEQIGAHLAHLTPKEATQLHQWTLKASPAVPNMITDIMLPSMLASPDHSLRDLSAIARGMRYSDDQLFQQLMTTDLRALGLRFELPFFVFQGDSDALTPTATARAYFEEVMAPHKEFVLIERCGHLAAFARPDQFLAELLTHVRPLVVAGSHALR